MSHGVGHGLHVTQREFGRHGAVDGCVINGGGGFVGRVFSGVDLAECVVRPRAVFSASHTRSVVVLWGGSDGRQSARNFHDNPDASLHPSSVNDPTYSLHRAAHGAALISCRMVLLCPRAD